MRQYIFLNQSEAVLFYRGDATKFVVNEDRYSLNAEFPHDSEKLIEEHMLLGFTDIDGQTQLYEIRTVNTSPFSDVDVVFAEHAAMTELLDDIIEDIRPTRVQAGVATTMALNGSRWSLLSAEATDTASMRFYFKSRWSALQTIAEKYGCGITFSWTLGDTGVTSRNVIVRQRLGADRGKRLELGKDLQSLNYIYDDSGVYTALYGRGKGESTLAGDDTNTPRLTFEDVVWSVDNGDPADKPQGQKFVEDITATALYGRNGRKRTGVIEFDDCEDAAELLGLTWSALQEINRPTVTVKATVCEMESVWGFSHEAVRLGDDVAIIDRGNAIKAKVSALSRDYINSDNTRLTIGTIVASIIDVQASLDSRIADAKAAGNAGKAVAAKNPELLNGYIDTMVTRILSTGTNRATDTDGGEIYTTTDGTKAVKLTGSGILCASSRIGDVWQWRTAIDGGGIIADMITTGVLQASLVKILGTTQFYWDSDNIYILNPEDNNKQIRIGAYDGDNLGIGFTQDGGETWQNAIGFDGCTLQAGSVTQDKLDPAIDFGGSTIYYEATEPTEATEGDIWYDTSASHTIKRFNGQTWQDITNEALYSALTAAGTAQATADGKIKTYAQNDAPTGLRATDVGDLWIDTNDSNKLYRWNGSAWVAYQDIHLDSIVSTHTTQIAANATAITLKASQASLDTLSGRVTTAEGQITVQAGQIALKVSAGDIASSINQTAQSVLINASKINLTGYVTITSLGSGGTTAIDGARITTGTIAASRIDVNNLWVKHLNGADGTFSGTLSAGFWTFNSDGAFYNTGYQQVQLQISGNYARYTTWNLSALYGSTSYNDTRVYGGAVILDCASAGQSVSARNGYWGSYSYSDVCFVCDQAGSSYDSARGNLGTTDNRWDVLWCDTVHYRTRASDSCRDAKHSIQPLQDFGSVIDQLAPVSYKYNDDRTQRTRYGLIYEDTIGLMPDICVESEEGGHTFMGISYEDLIAVLLGEVQRLRQRVASLETPLEQA